MAKNGKNKAKVAVVGGGIFGITASIKLAQEGYGVDLIEKENDIMRAASGINQLRLHRGFHYPRSDETTRDSIRTEISFRNEYGDAVIDGGEQYYCIAKEGSLVSVDQYVEFCNRFGLSHTPVKPGFLNHDNLVACFLAKEGRIDPLKLKKICLSRMKKYDVKLKLNTTASPEMLKKYDFVVLCAYAGLNSLLSEFQDRKNKYQYELCEKPVVKLPPAFQGKSVVVMDGPFMCFDPFGSEKTFLFGNVVHAIHQANVGFHPEIEERFRPFLNKGIVKNPAITNFNKFIESGTKFIPDLVKAEHIGSMFTLRTVLPHRENTDERPTIVTKINDGMVAVFSGKFSNCVEAAEKVVAAAKETLN